MANGGSPHGHEKKRATTKQPKGPNGKMAAKAKAAPQPAKEKAKKKT